jgi:hypothetical protein
VRGVIVRVFRYAITTGCAKYDIAADLKGALLPVKRQSYAAITDPAIARGYKVMAWRISGHF